MAVLAMAKKKPGRPKMGPEPKRTVVNLKGSPAWGDWLGEISERTMIPASKLIEVAMKEWAERNGHPAPPKR